DHVRPEPEIVENRELGSNFEVVLGDAGDVVTRTHLHPSGLGDAGQRRVGLIGGIDVGVVEKILQALPPSRKPSLDALPASLVDVLEEPTARALSDHEKDVVRGGGAEE